MPREKKARGTNQATPEEVRNNLKQLKEKKMERIRELNEYIHKAYAEMQSIAQQVRDIDTLLKNHSR